MGPQRNDDVADAALYAALLAGPEPASESIDRRGLAASSGASAVLLEALERTGLLVPHHVDASGAPRYTSADVEAVRAGLVLLDEGLPLGELLALAEQADAAISGLAEVAVDAFVAFVRDAALGAEEDAEQTAARLVRAYERMLPATTYVVAHHLRRRLLTSALGRLGALGEPSSPSDGTERSDDR